MKKTLFLALTLAGAAGAYAQGTVEFNDHVVGTIAVEVYSPQLLTPGVETTGNSATDTPSGTTVYTGVPLGGSSTGTGATGYANGANYSAELYAAPGGTLTAPLAFSALSPVSQYTSTFFTVGAGAGLFIAVSPANDPGISGVTSSTQVASLALAAWYNGGGTITSLNAAESGGVPYGWSTPFALSALGNLPAAVGSTTAPNLTGLTSFSLVTPVPEPGTITLAVMGAAALLMRRRSK
jgi:uncharacterized protein (TIGR03382 family)